jgi:hypothetical protein
MGWFKRRHEEEEAALAHRHAQEAWRQRVFALRNEGDGTITPQQFDELCDFADSDGIAIAEDPETELEIRLGLAQGGVFLDVSADVLLREGEFAGLDVPVSLLEEVADRQYVGGSRGVSVPLGHGVRYHAASYRGHMESVGSHWVSADEGRLTVTNTRAVYSGTRRTLEFPYTKLVALNVFADAIALGVTSRQTTSTFATPAPGVIAAVIQSTIRHQPDGVTLIYDSTAAALADVPGVDWTKMPTEQRNQLLATIHESKERMRRAADTCAAAVRDGKMTEQAARTSLDAVDAPLASKRWVNEVFERARRADGGLQTGQRETLTQPSRQEAGSRPGVDTPELGAQPRAQLTVADRNMLQAAEQAAKEAARAVREGRCSVDEARQLLASANASASMKQWVNEQFERDLEAGDAKRP